MLQREEEEEEEEEEEKVEERLRRTCLRANTVGATAVPEEEKK